MSNVKKKDPLAGGQGGRGVSDQDIKAVYQAAASAQGGKSGRSISDKDVAAFLGRAYAMAKGIVGKKRAKSLKKQQIGSALKRGGKVKKYAHGGSVRKAKY